jgi:sulfotransferase family protein
VQRGYLSCMSRADSPLRGRLIFVVGARRSGTNWVQRIIGSHPQAVEVPSETYLFSHGIRPLAERIQHAAPGQGRTGFVYMDPEEFRDAARDFCDRVFTGLMARIAPSAPGGARLVERTPDHVHHLDLIGAVYPDARVVNVVRDGRDVARSLVAQRWGPSRIDEAAEEWRSAVRAARQADRGVELVEVRYEELLADPAGSIGPLYERLELESSPQTIDRALGESGATYNIDPTAPDVRQEKWREGMSGRELRQFERVAGAELAELGYAERPATAGSSPRRPGVRRAEMLRRPLRSLRRRRGSGIARETLGRAAAAQVIVDGVLTAINTGELERLEGLLDAEVHVRVTGGDTEWSERGRPALDRLVSALRDDPALRGTQIRGDVHPSVPSFFAFSTYELPGGGRAERAAVLTVEGDRVSELTWYQPPGPG